MLGAAVARLTATEGFSAGGGGNSQPQALVKPIGIHSQLSVHQLAIVSESHKLSGPPRALLHLNLIPWRWVWKDLL